MIDTSPAAIAAIVDRERHRRFPYQPAGRDCANVIETLAAERDRLSAENARLRMRLQSIVDSYEASSELHTSAANCAENLYDHARAALKGDSRD